MKLPLESSTLLLVLKFLIIRINLFLNAKLYFKNNSYKKKNKKKLVHNELAPNTYNKIWFFAFPFPWCIYYVSS